MSKIVDRIFNTVLTAMDSSAKEELGSFRFEDGNIYKYVEHTDAVTTIAGGPILMNGTSSYTVTSDLNGGAGVGSVVGVALTAGTAGYYGWIQIYGPAVVRIFDNVTAGDRLIACTTDNYWSVSKTDTSGIGYMPGARALMASVTDTTGTTMTALIRCM